MRKVGCNQLYALINSYIRSFQGVKMKGILEFIGLCVVIFSLLAFLFGDFISTEKETNSQAIKDKIEIIAVAENSDDPTVKAQADIARSDLKSLQAAKEIADNEAIAASKAKAAKEAARADAKVQLKDDPYHQTMKMLIIVIAAVLTLGAACIFIPRILRGYS